MGEWLEKSDDGNEIELYRVFTVIKKDGKIIFREDCDQFFFEKFTKEEALELLQQIKDWINNE